MRRGLPAFTVVGLPDASVREARERVRSALLNSGLDFPLQRITANLAPASVRKAGPSFDLALAVGVLVAGGQVPAEPLAGAAVCGELSLSGTLRPVRGMLASALAARASRVRARHRARRQRRRGGPGRGPRGAPRRRHGRAGRPPAWALGARAGHGRAQRTRGPVPARPTSPRCAASTTPSGRWRSRPPAATTCSWSDRPGRGRRCSPAACPASSRHPTSTRRWTSPACTAWPGWGRARSPATGRSARPTTRSRPRGSSVEGPALAPVR